jgi:hypothetical protein
MTMTAAQIRHRKQQGLPIPEKPVRPHTEVQPRYRSDDFNPVPLGMAMALPLMLLGGAR